jgi:transcriptional regulator GlxA family with amidase domain
LFADDLRRRYPDIEVTADQMIIDHGDAITSGGATAFLNLAIYLVERIGGYERANLAAKGCWSTATAKANCPTSPPYPDDLTTIGSFTKSSSTSTRTSTNRCGSARWPRSSG